MKGKKILIIVIILVAALAIVGTTFAYLFLATDILKGTNELFAKYITQNFETYSKLKKSEILNTYNSLKNEDKYEENSELKVTYSEGGEISNPFNNLSAKLTVQKDNDKNYYYADGQILFADEEYLESEIIKENGIYGIRFSDVAKQFIGIKNDQNLEEVSKDIGIDSIYLNTLMNIIDGTQSASEEVISKQDAENLKDKYLKIVTDAITNGTFSKQTKAMITYNNTTTKTNAYMVSLSSQQVENMIIQILNTAKSDTTLLDKFSNFINEDIITTQLDEQIRKITEEYEIPSLKITVYENGKKTIRTLVEIGSNKIVIENVETSGNIKSNIQMSLVQDDETSQYKIEIIRKFSNDSEENEIKFTNLNNEENDENVTMTSNIQKANDSSTIESGLSYKNGILNIGVSLTNEIKLENDFEKKQTLAERNYIVLNDLSAERRKMIIDDLKKKVPEKAELRTELLLEALQLKKGTVPDVPDYEMPQVEINKFNSKFEFYAGDQVSASNVKVLLNIVKDNLGSVEITPINPENASGIIRDEDIKYNFKLNIEKGKSNEQDTQNVSDKIKENKKYKVSINYKDINGLIDNIVMEELDK